MQGLSHFMQDEVRDIDNIIDGADTDGFQLVLHPPWRFFNGDALQADARIPLTGTGILDAHRNGQDIIIRFKSAEGRQPGPVLLILMMREPGAYIPGDPLVAHGVHMIRGKPDLYNMIRIRVEPGSGSHPYFSFFG